MTAESILEKEVENFMRNKRIWQLARFQAASNQNGIPDRLYLYKGLLLGLELKVKDKGRASDLQLKKIDMINKNGGIGVIITSVKQLKRLIDTIDLIIWEDIFIDRNKELDIIRNQND